jgi:two-component system nitrogen regulation response regulator GlnG
MTTQEFPMSINNILVADDDEGMRWVLSKVLRKKGFNVELARDGDEALRLIKENIYDLALLDIKMPGLTGLELLDRIKQERSDLFVVIMTAEATMGNAVEAMKRGAYDYLTKPFDLVVIDALVEKVSRAREMASQVSVLKNELKGLYPFEKTIIGDSPAMQEIYKMIGKVAPSDATVLLLGESGTGKELIARAIHNNSKRLGNPFVTLNCAAIPKELLESELFGFDKGAFTGATERKLGKFEQANGGTLFLDEIGDMPFDLQSKILRVLQEREIIRTGGSQSIQVDARIVAATNQDLEESVRKRFFREDLYYRLNVIPFHLIPLRERREDVPLLVDYFLTKICAELEVPLKRCSTEAMRLLTSYSWPGNIRELENTIKRGVILSSDPLLIAADFPVLTSQQGEELSLEGIVELKLRGSFTNIEQMEKSDVFAMVLKQVERPLIRFVLEKTRGNQVRAADILGINRNTLRKMIKDLGIELHKE